jgi:hypothetical protein
VDLFSNYVFIFDKSMRMGDYNVETETPEDLREELLNRGYSKSIAEKIVEHYTKGSESF